MHFDGSTYTHDRDGKRLGAQYLRVFNLMRDGQFRTLREIKDTTGDPESSVSARLRDMRKERFGSYQVERRYVADGLFEYKLNAPQEVLKDEKLPTQDQIDAGPHAGLGNIPSDYGPGKVTMTVDGWTYHDGKSVPTFPEGAVVHVKFRDGYIDDTGTRTVEYWAKVFGNNNWITAGQPGSGRSAYCSDFDIVGYKIVRN